MNTLSIYNKIVSCDMSQNEAGLQKLACVTLLYIGGEERSDIDDRLRQEKVDGAVNGSWHKMANTFAEIYAEGLKGNLATKIKTLVTDFHQRADKRAVSLGLRHLSVQCLIDHMGNKPTVFSAVLDAHKGDKALLTQWVPELSDEQMHDLADDMATVNTLETDIKTAMDNRAPQAAKRLDSQVKAAMLKIESVLRGCQSGKVKESLKPAFKKILGFISEVKDDESLTLISKRLAERRKEIKAEAAAAAKIAKEKAKEKAKIQQKIDQMKKRESDRAAMDAIEAEKKAKKRKATRKAKAGRTVTKPVESQKAA